MAVAVTVSCDWLRRYWVERTFLVLYYFYLNIWIFLKVQAKLTCNIMGFIAWLKYEKHLFLHLSGFFGVWVAPWLPQMSRWLVAMTTLTRGPPFIILVLHLRVESSPACTYWPDQNSSLLICSQSGSFYQMRSKRFSLCPQMNRNLFYI